MQNAAMVGLTLVVLAAAVYAQYRLPFHSATRFQLWFSRILLLTLGIAFGWVMSQRFPVEGVTRALLFVSAFGVVHVPAAVILFIKRRRNEWQ